MYATKKQFISQNKKTTVARKTHIISELVKCKEVQLA